MTKSVFRAVLAGCVAASASTAQTPRPLTPTSTPPAPVQRVAFKQVLPAAEAPAKLAVQVFNVADLVSPPPDSPLAKPSDDVAVKAAVKAYSQVKAEQLLNRLRDTVGFHAGTLEIATDGHTLVARDAPAVLERVGECLESLRELRDAQVRIEMVLVSVPSDRTEIVKLFGDKPTAALTAVELKTLLHGLKQDGAVEVLSAPRLMLTNKQAGHIQIGQQVPIVASGACSSLQPVAYQQVGLVTHMTPDLSADGKFIRLKLDVQHSQPGLKGCALDCQKVATTLTLPTGGTMAVKVGTRKTERRIESKLPVLGDLPYVGRLFRNIGITHVERDTIAIVTVTRVEPVAVRPAPLPIAPKPKGSLSLQFGWSAKSGPTASLSVKPAPPVAVPPPVAQSPAVVRDFARQQHPITLQEAFEIAVVQGKIGQAPDLIATPAPVARLVPQMFRTVGADGLERIGIDFNMNQPTPPLRAAVGGGCGSCCDTPVSLMKAYRAACAAGKKDEAARLALQLLAKDPTCFGRSE